MIPVNSFGLFKILSEITLNSKIKFLLNLNSQILIIPRNVIWAKEFKREYWIFNTRVLQIESAVKIWY
jgi:hypothetical protein